MRLWQRIRRWFHRETYIEYVQRESEQLRQGGPDINPYNADPEND